jgi:catechol 2,3-dioxygenase-like lactoylglutathione lyase family enzyme
MAFSLTLSHVGIHVVDLPRMVDFYTGFMGFAISDRGPTRDAGEIVFMTRDPREHHQFVLASGRPAALPFNLINQLSFRVDSVDTLRELQAALAREDGVEDLGPTSHGNAISVYFRDPEGNRVELLAGTPWYVPQPIRLPVDLSLPDDQLWASVEAACRAVPGFMTRAAWEADIERRIAEATAKRRSRSAGAAVR